MAGYLLRRHKLRVRLEVANVSTLRSLVRAATLLGSGRSRSVGYVHGTSALDDWRGLDGLRRSLIRKILNRLDEVWVNNREVERFFRSEVSLSTVRIVSPYPAIKGSGRPTGERVATSSGDRRDYVIAVGQHPRAYGLELGIDVVKRLRGLSSDARLTVLSYGPRTGSDQVYIEEHCSLPWITVLSDLPEAEVTRVLSGAAALFRPTIKDGDSVIVREALAVGTRVIASKNVPRPQGVELAELSPITFVEAVVHGGALSDGSGMGNAVDEVIIGLLPEPMIKPW